jgi:hypothetical protein
MPLVPPTTCSPVASTTCPSTSSAIRCCWLCGSHVIRLSTAGRFITVNCRACHAIVQLEAHPPDAADITMRITVLCWPENYPAPMPTADFSPPGIEAAPAPPVPSRHVSASGASLQRHDKGHTPSPGPGDVVTSRKVPSFRHRDMRLCGTVRTTSTVRGATVASELSWNRRRHGTPRT